LPVYKTPTFLNPEEALSAVQRLDFKKGSIKKAEEMAHSVPLE
jgi:hypothetical protein